MNIVTYNISKTEAVLFLKSHQEQLNKPPQEKKITIGSKKSYLTKKLYNG